MAISWWRNVYEGGNEFLISLPSDPPPFIRWDPALLHCAFVSIMNVVYQQWWVIGINFSNYIVCRWQHAAQKNKPNLIKNSAIHWPSNRSSASCHLLQFPDKNRGKINIKKTERFMDHIAYLNKRLMDYIANLKSSSK